MKWLWRYNIEEHALWRKPSMTSGEATMQATGSTKFNNFNSNPLFVLRNSFNMLQNSFNKH